MGKACLPGYSTLDHALPFRWSQVLIPCGITLRERIHSRKKCVESRFRTVHRVLRGRSWHNYRRVRNRLQTRLRNRSRLSSTSCRREHPCFSKVARQDWVLSLFRRNAELYGDYSNLPIAWNPARSIIGAKIRGVASSPLIVERYHPTSFRARDLSFRCMGGKHGAERTDVPDLLGLFLRW